MEKKLSDKDFTSQDLLQMLHEKYKTPWKHEEIEAHMHNLSTDEILDEMIMVYRDNSLPLELEGCSVLLPSLGALAALQRRIQTNRQ